ncbi:MAG: SDR family oxidoreductase [Anaerovoracaceae bacterium]
MNWNQKVIVVTGADHQVGKALCRMFASENARVYAIGEDRSQLSELDSTNVKVVSCSIDDISCLNASLEEIGITEGHIDAVFCDTRFSDPGMTATELTADIINEAMKKTTYYAWKSALYAVPYLKESDHGAVCFITNNSVRHPKKTNVLTAICSTSIESITKNFSSEIASSNIRMTAIAVDEDVCPEKAAGSAAFLVSPQASYITGCMIEVDHIETEGDK